MEPWLGLQAQQQKGTESEPWALPSPQGHLAQDLLFLTLSPRMQAS